jgi:hypothetical protein
MFKQSNWLLFNFKYLLNGNPFGCYISSCRNLWIWKLNTTTPPPILKVNAYMFKILLWVHFPISLGNFIKGIYNVNYTNQLHYSFHIFLPSSSDPSLVPFILLFLPPCCHLLNNNRLLPTSPLHSYDILGAGMLWKPKEAWILTNFIDQPMNIR